MAKTTEQKCSQFGERTNVKKKTKKTTYIISNCRQSRRIHGERMEDKITLSSTGASKIPPTKSVITIAVLIYCVFRKSQHISKNLNGEKTQKTDLKSDYRLNCICLYVTNNIINKNRSGMYKETKLKFWCLLNRTLQCHTSVFYSS